MAAHSLRIRAATALALSLGVAGAATAPAATAAPVGPIPGLSTAAVDLMNSAPYQHATWAIAVSDVDTGAALVSHNSEALLEPASVTKTYSVGAAWLKFGPDSRIVTPVVRTGRVAGRTLKGDLILVAKGDITMGGQTGPDGHVVFTNMDHNDANVLPGATIAGNNPLAGLDKLAREVKRSGISRVSGQVIIDDRLFATADLGENDGPVSPIVINNNLIDLVTSPTTAGRKARITMRPKVAPWKVANRVRTVAAGGATRIEISATTKGVITLAGTIAAGGDPQLKVWHFSDPATFARTAFIEALKRAGVKVSARPTAPNPLGKLPSRARVARAKQVAALTGLPLEENGKYILKVSYNRGAQTQVCLLAAAIGSTDCDAGFPEMARVLTAAGIDPRGASFVDGSGLPGNFITAASEVQLMTVFGHRPDARRWQDALPIMGVDGSIATVGQGTPAAGNVFAKTGTLGAGDFLNSRLRLETKALGGYVIAASGRRLAIAILVNQAMFDDLQGVFAANDDLGRIAASIYADY